MKFIPDILNYLIQRHGYKSYLEIGVREGTTFKKVKCKKKRGVDVISYPDVTHAMPSDEFFKINTEETFDLIFIDGLHHHEQVLRDIYNSLKVLRKSGTIVCHDMNPTTKEMQIVPCQFSDPAKPWTGDCWKAWVTLRQQRDDLSMRVVDTSSGMGIIQRGSQKTVDVTESLTYENLERNREKWLNLISVEEFERIY